MLVVRTLEVFYESVKVYKGFRPCAVYVFQETSTSIFVFVCAVELEVLFDVNWSSGVYFSCRYAEFMSKCSTLHLLAAAIVSGILTDVFYAMHVVVASLSQCMPGCMRSPLT